MSKANKRIPVTEDRWNELNEIKEAGQTYDELIEELLEVYREQRLAEMVRNRRDDDDAFTEVDPESW
jgi:predicted CopG family antitoxin